MRYIGQDGVISLRTVRLTAAVNGSPVVWYTHLHEALQRRFHQNHHLLRCRAQSAGRIEGFFVVKRS